MIRGVLFDVDDTLVDTRGAFRHALSHVAASYLTAPIDPERLGLTWRTDAGGHYRSYTRGEISYREQRMRRANELHALYGGPELNEARYDEWNTMFEQAFRDGWLAHNDALPVLDELDRGRLAYGALSNAGHAYQEQKLAACGLSRVRMLVGVDTLGYGKPDSRVFARACELLDLPPDQVAYVGDELDIDAQAAVAAGLAVGVWLDRTGASTSAALPLGVRRVTTLADLSHVLKEI